MYIYIYTCICTYTQLCADQVLVHMGLLYMRRACHVYWRQRLSVLLWISFTSKLLSYRVSSSLEGFMHNVKLGTYMFPVLDTWSFGSFAWLFVALYSAQFPCSSSLELMPARRDKPQSILGMFPSNLLLHSQNMTLPSNSNIVTVQRMAFEIWIVWTPFT